MVKQKLILFICVLSSFGVCRAQISPGQCVPREEYIPFVGSWAKPEPSTGNIELGSYSRISPDGEYVMRSMSGSYLSTVSLMHLSPVGSSSPRVTAIETSFENEAFPVQGSWRFLVEVGGYHHRLEDVVKFGKSSQREFRAGVLGFYATAAEMGADSDGSIRIRSLSWPNEAIEGQAQGAGPLKNTIYKVQKNQEGHYKVLSESSDFYLCGNLIWTEGSMFTLPMISADGSEFSALPLNSKSKPSMRIYKILENNKSCQVVSDLGYAGSKMIFGFAKNGNPAPVVFKASAGSAAPGGSGIYIYDRTLKGSFEISGLTKEVETDSFPGFTKDGRVVVGARWQDCVEGRCEAEAGYLRVDPYQTAFFQKYKKDYPQKSGHLPDCFKYADLTK